MNEYTFTANDIKSICASYRKLDSAATIAKRFDVSGTCILRILRNAGVAIRKRGRMKAKPAPKASKPKAKAAKKKACPRPKPKPKAKKPAAKAKK